jgi:hypothetical protein
MNAFGYKPHRAYKDPKGQLLLRLTNACHQSHSIELLNLIRVLNLPSAGWHKFKSRRKAIFSKALHELKGITNADAGTIDLQIQQGLNGRDFMLVARLVSNEMLQSSIAK